MARKGYTEEQIIAVLNEADAGAKNGWGGGRSPFATGATSILAEVATSLSGLACAFR